MSALSLLPEHSKSLVFGSGLRKDLRLLEVDERLLEEIIDSGVTIKGQPNEKAVLCTSKTTFALKHVETTNTLFIVPRPSQAAAVEASERVTVTATAAAHIEVVPTAPRFAALDRILEATQIGEEGDDAGPSGSDATAAMRPCALDELLARTQASAAELRSALRQRGAVELDGAWRLVSRAYLGTLLDMLLLSAAQHGWELSAIPVADACSVMEADGFHPALARHCLMLHATGSSTKGAGGAGQPTTACLDQQKVCLHFARSLLREQPRWPLHDFMARWRSSVPEGMAPDAGMLRGEALVDDAGGAEFVQAFAAADLPADPAQRFAVIFAARPRWALPDLQPYLADMQVPGRSAEALLLMYARTSQDDPAAPVMYSAR